MAELEQKIHIKQGNTVQEVTLYTTTEEASAYGTYGTARYNNANCYYALGTGADTNTGSAYVTPLRVTKDGIVYYMLTQGVYTPQTLVLTNDYYEMSEVYPDNYRNMTEVPDILDTSNLTTAFCMFYGCNNLISAPILDTSNITNMYEMFDWCTSLVSVPELDTSNVTNMRDLFSHCQQLAEVPTLNTSKATDMGSMFSGCYALTSIPQLDTSNVTNMRFMFAGTCNITTIPQFDTSKVTDMRGMFQGTGGIGVPISNITTVPQMDTSKVQDMSLMFRDCIKLPSTFPWTIDCSSITTPGAEDNYYSGMYHMFYGSSVTRVTLANVNESIKSQITSTLLKGDYSLTINFV